MKFYYIYVPITCFVVRYLSLISAWHFFKLWENLLILSAMFYKQMQEKNRQKKNRNYGFSIHITDLIIIYNFTVFPLTWSK